MISEKINLIFSKLYNGIIKIENCTKETKAGNNFYIIPGKFGPKWIVPENDSIALNLLTQWQPYELSSRLKWKVIINAYKFKQLEKIPGIKKVTIRKSYDIIGQNSYNQDECELFPVIYIGTPGQDQKAVASLIKPGETEPCCVIKIPMGKNAPKKIIHEALMIKKINETKNGIAPSIYFVDEKKGVAGQKSISGKLSGRELTNEHIKFLISLADKNITNLYTHCTFLIKQINTLVGKTVSADKIFIQTILKKYSDLTPLPSFWFHGDFAPWNLKISKGVLRAIDWEDAQMNCLPLQDLMHFFVIQDFLFGKKMRGDENLKNDKLNEYCKALDIPADKILDLTIFFLANSWFKQNQNNNIEYAHFLMALIKQMAKY